MEKLQDKLNELMDLFVQIKGEIKSRDRHLYERWKAGGFTVDTDIVSMYPDLTECVEKLDAELDEEIELEE
jgi:hypothetical protein